MRYSFISRWLLVALFVAAGQAVVLAKEVPKAEVVEPVAAPAAAVALNADRSLEVLQAGNSRFEAGKMEHPRQDAGRREMTLKDGQHPIASILTCSDSRVPPEDIFDVGIGDVFVVRDAGNVAGTDQIGSLEYGAGHLNTPLIVVMGHTKCGAVTAAVKGDKVGGNIAALLARIAPAVKKVKDAKVAPEEQLGASIRENIQQSMADILAKSPEIRELVIQGKVRLVGASYDIATGKVEWLGEHPKQTQLLGFEGAMETLKRGNERMVRGERTYPHLDGARREKLASIGQAPFASILTCADSRVPAEEIFDAGIGDIFVVRVAGNVAGAEEIGTLEYGAGHLGTPLVVVMGHKKCGAVTAVVKGDKVGGSIAPMVARIVPAVKKAKGGKDEPVTDELVEKAIKENVWQAIADIFARSEEMRELVSEKKVKVVGALYDIGTGEVEWIGEHPKQKELLNVEASAASSAGAEAKPAEGH